MKLLTGRDLLAESFGGNLSQARTFFERLCPAWKHLIPLQSLLGEPQRVPSAINKKKLAAESWNYQPELQRGKWRGGKELHKPCLRLCRRVRDHDHVCGWGSVFALEILCTAGHQEVFARGLDRWFSWLNWICPKEGWSLRMVTTWVKHEIILLFLKCF